MEFPAQHRYSIAFPMVCAHFMQATHELCPEEVRHKLAVFKHVILVRAAGPCTVG